jgi:hypothetical protein
MNTKLHSHPLRVRRQTAMKFREASTNLISIALVMPKQKGKQKHKKPQNKIFLVSSPKKKQSGDPREVDDFWCKIVTVLCVS